MGNILQIGYQLETSRFSPFYVPIESIEKVDVEGYQNGLKKADGVLLPTYVRNLSIINKMKFKRDDTIVIGFPKSGF
jgi:hypothetical protein